MLSLSVLAAASQLYAANLDVVRVIDENQVGQATTCLIMNQAMASSPDQKDINSFVNIENRNTGKAAAVNVMLNDRSVCLTGLEFGTKYVATLKKGLRSAEGGVLNANKDVEFTTIDRGQTVSFIGGHVLATSSKEKKIGVESINFDKFRINLFKISNGDLPTYSNMSLTDHSIWSAADYIKDHGVFLGSKEYTVDVKTNEKQITTIDLNELSKDLTSGIYAVVLTNIDAPECDQSAECMSEMEDNNDKYMVLEKSLIISNLGVTSYHDDSGITVAVRSLTDSKPVANALVKLISSTNDVLGTVKTNADGYATFPKQLANGSKAITPALVNVSTDSDLFSLDIRYDHLYIENNGAETPKLDPDFKIFAYTNRTLVRPGEKVFYEAIVRNKDFVATDLKALKLMIYRPDGMLHREVALQNPKAGAFDYEFEFDKSADTGSWRFALGFDKSKVLNYTTVTVDNFIPSTIVPTVKTDAKILKLSDDIEVNTRFTYDAPAPDIPVDGNFQVSPDSHPVEKYDKYFFGISEDRRYEYLNYGSLTTMYTGKSGNLLFNVKEHFNVEEQPFPQFLKVRINVVDPSNKILGMDKVYKISYPNPMPGIKFDFDRDDATHSKFPVIIADQAGKLYKGDVNYSIRKKNISYQYVFREGRWEYLRNEYFTPVVSGVLNVSENENSVIDYQFENGSYEVTLNYNNEETTAGFYAGSRSSIDSKYPDRIELFADQKKYKPGDTAVLEFDSAYDGYADLFLDNVKDNKIKHYSIRKGHNRIKVDIDGSFKKGSYAILTTYSNGENKYLGVQRAVGLTYLDMDASSRILNVSADIPAAVKPNGGVDIKVKVDGADNDTYITAALIDQGILSINHQKAPSPDKFIYGQESFTTEISDVYAHIMKSVDRKNQGYGGDDDDSPIGVTPLDNITEDLLSFYTRTVKVENGYATVHYDLKDTSSTATFMVSAWSKDKLGSFSADIPVKDNTVAKLNLPYYMHKGDRLSANLSLNNLGAGNQVYNYKINCSGALSCKAEGSINVAANRLDRVPLEVSAKNDGDGFVEIAVDGNDYRFNTSKKFHVINPLSSIVENRVIVLEPNSKKEITFNNKFTEGTDVSINVGKIPLTNTAKLLAAVMESNNYNIFDQASAGLAALEALNRVEKSAQIDEKEQKKLQKFVNDQVQAVQSKISNYGGINEGFIEYDESKYGTAYAGLFLVQADKAGFNVNRNVLRVIRTSLTIYQSEGNENTSALSMYVLTLMGENVKTNLVYQFDHIYNKSDLPIEAFSYYANTFGLYGDTNRQQLAISKGIKLMDELNKMKATDVSGYTVDAYLEHIQKILKYIPYRTNCVTHDTLALIRASMKAKSDKGLEKLYSYLSKDQYNYDNSSSYLLIALSSEFGNTPSKSSAAKVKNNSVTVTNDSKDIAVATVTAHGYVTKSASPKGLAYTQEYYDQNGKKLTDPLSVKVNSEIVVVTTFEYSYPYSGNVVLEHKIPSNMVLVNTLTKEQLKKKYPSIPFADNFGYPDVVRGDTAFITREYRYKTRKVSTAYVLKAVTKGTSAPLMSSGFIKDGNTSMFSSYNPNKTLTVK